MLSLLCESAAVGSSAKPQGRRSLTEGLRCQPSEAHLTHLSKKRRGSWFIKVVPWLQVDSTAATTQQLTWHALLRGRALLAGHAAVMRMPKLLRWLRLAPFRLVADVTPSAPGQVEPCECLVPQLALQPALGSVSRIVALPLVRSASEGLSLSAAYTGNILLYSDPRCGLQIRLAGCQSCLLRLL